MPRFLTLRDVANYLNVREAQVYVLVRSGDLPAIKIGGRGVWRVDRERLGSWIETLHSQTNEWTRSHPRAEPAPRPPRRSSGPRLLPSESEALTTRRAAEVIGVTRRGVYHLIQTGALRARRSGNQWIVSAEDAQEYRPLGEPPGSSR